VRPTIIGGGIMGLMAAYHAAPLAGSVTGYDISRFAPASFAGAGAAGQPQAGGVSS
jgi:glycine/D-amino acid oxidase-like deaminating enzyme